VPREHASAEAEAAVKAYFESLIHKDWQPAYQLLDEQVRAHWSESQFVQLAENYLNDLGFEPTEVRLMSCTERSESALAHVNLLAISESSQQFRREGISLRKSPSGWGIVPLTSFGRPKSGTRKSRG
jgi:hypothetical protein